MINSIQGLRAYAVVIVLLYHLKIGLFSRGYLGVDIFFTISGFVIYLAYAEKMSQKDQIYEFLKGRFFRLFPAYFVTTVIVACISVSFLLPQDAYRDIIDSLYSLSNTVNIYYLLSINYFSVDSDYRPLLHLWSLSVEQQYYFGLAIFAYLLFLMRKYYENIFLYLSRFKILLLSVVIIVSLTLSWIVRGIYEPADFFNPVTRAWQFGIGMMAAELFTKLGEADANRFSKYNGTIFTTLILIALIIASNFKLFSQNIFDQFVLSIVTSLLCFISALGASAKLLEAAVVQWLGKISYSLYLVHWPIIVFYRYLVNRAFNLTEIVGLALAAIGTAALLHYTVEAPWRSWSINNWRRRIFAFATSAVAFASVALALSHISFGGVDRDFRISARSVSGVRAEIDQHCIRRSGQNGHGIICEIKGRNAGPSLTLMGDSHLVPFVPSLAENAETDITLYISTGCLPLSGVKYVTYEHQSLCGNFFDKAWEEQPDGRPVILVARWNGYEALVRNPEHISSALDRTVARAKGVLSIVQQPHEYATQLPFAVGYSSSIRVLQHIRPRTVWFSDGIPPLLKAPIKKPMLIMTRKQICDIPGTQVNENKNCFFSEKHGLFFSDDNHIVPSIAHRVRIIK
jgi:peptidoglycan/LPS O-acetylase OafA/YrhL